MAPIIVASVQDSNYTPQMKQHEPEGRMLGNVTYLLYVAPSNPIPIDLIHETISHYIIHFRMAKAHECPLAAVCNGCKQRGMKGSSARFFRFSESPNLMNYRKKLLNDRNGRRQLIVVLVEVSSLLLLPKVATASKSVWMVYLLGSELGSLLHHGNPYCTLYFLPSFIAIRLVKQSALPSFCNLPSGSDDVISQLRVRG